MEKFYLDRKKGDVELLKTLLFSSDINSTQRTNMKKEL
jgi:hypothetical protein